MTPAGSIRIDLQHRFGNATGVQISSTRPAAVAQVLTGKTPEQLLDTIPLLFTLCGNAQAYAALLACRAALGLPGEPDSDSARDMLVQVETLREHAWRIVLDWPGFVGLGPDKKALAALLKFDALFKRHLFRDGEAFKLDSCLNIEADSLNRLIDELEALVDTAIFNGRLAGFAALTTEAQLRDWLKQNDALPAKLLDYLYSQDWMAAGQNGVSCLPELDCDNLNRQLQQENLSQFSLTPHWQGRCFEATLLNRQLSQPLIADIHSRYGNGLTVRTLARLLELALIPSQLRISQNIISSYGSHAPRGNPGWDAPASRTAERFSLHSHAERRNDENPKCSGATNNGTALAQVQAARGLLIHRLELRQGRVHDYRIIAPTEWNFHPEGVVAQGLKQLTAANPNNLKQQAELYINAIDPCVQYALHLRPQP